MDCSALGSADREDGHGPHKGLTGRSTPGSARRLYNQCIRRFEAWRKIAAPPVLFGHRQVHGRDGGFGGALNGGGVGVTSRTFNSEAGRASSLQLFAQRRQLARYGFGYQGQRTRQCQDHRTCLLTARREV